MGCAGEKEKLEDEILLMKLDRMEIQLQKELAMKQLSKKGVAVKQGHIPDFVDPVFAKENNIYEDDEYMLNNIKNAKTDGKKEKKFDDVKSENLAVKKRAKTSKNVRVKTDIGDKKKKKRSNTKKSKHSD